MKRSRGTAVGYLLGWAARVGAETAEDLPLAAAADEKTHFRSRPLDV